MPIFVKTAWPSSTMLAQIDACPTRGCDARCVAFDPVCGVSLALLLLLFKLRCGDVLTREFKV